MDLSSPFSPLHQPNSATIPVNLPLAPTQLPLTMTFDHQQAESQAADAAQVLQEACDKKIDEDDLAGLRSLLQQWKDPTNIASKPTTDDFESLLVGAIKGHKLDILEFLLDNGAELTSLVMQMCAGHASLQAFRLFMQHGWQPPGDPPIPLRYVHFPQSIFHVCVLARLQHARQTLSKYIEAYIHPAA